MDGEKFKQNDASTNDRISFVWEEEELDLSSGQTVAVKLEERFTNKFGDTLTARLTVDGGWSGPYHLVSDGAGGHADWFVVNLPQGNKYRIKIESSDTPRFPAKIRHIFDQWSRKLPGTNYKTIDIDLKDSDAHPAGDFHIHVASYYVDDREEYRLRVDILT